MKTAGTHSAAVEDQVSYQRLIDELTDVLMPAKSEEIRLVFGHLSIAQAEAWKSGKVAQAEFMRLRPSLSNIIANYRRAREVREKVGTIDGHRKRLFQIAASARKLAGLLSAEVLMLELETGTDARAFPPLGDPERWETEYPDDLICQLRELSDNADELAQNDAWLRKARRDKPDGVDQKSLERILLWEPIFARWKVAGRRVPVSRGGPLLKFLAVIHNALDIPPPGEDAVHKASADFNRKRVAQT